MRGRSTPHGNAGVVKGGLHASSSFSRTFIVPESGQQKRECDVPFSKNTDTCHTDWLPAHFLPDIPALLRCTLQQLRGLTRVGRNDGARRKKYSQCTSESQRKHGGEEACRTALMSFETPNNCLLQELACRPCGCTKIIFLH